MPALVFRNRAQGQQRQAQIDGAGIQDIDGFVELVDP